MYLLKLVSQQGQTLQQINLKSGNLQRIAAVDNVHYQLADAQSGLGAQGVQAGRAGNDLLVHIQGEPTLLIEDYFLLDDSGLKNPLLGMNGSGQYVAYPIADSAPVILEHQLAGELTTAGASASAPPAAVVAGIAGVALVGAAIAGGSKGSRSANDEAPQPQTPFDPNQPAPPPPGGGSNPPPGGGGTNPPPGGGGSNPPPGGGGTNPPPGGGGTNPPPGGGGTNPPPGGGGGTNPPPGGGGTNPPPGGGGTNPPPGGGGTNPPPGGGGTNPPPGGGGGTNPPPGGGGTNPPPATDTTPPTLTISTANPSLKPGENTQITFTLSEKVAGFDASDIRVTGGTLSNFTQVNDTTYTATFTAGANPGNASVRVDTSAFQDEAGNANDTASNLALVISNAPDTTPPTLTISAANPSLKPGEDTQITFTLSEKVAGFDASDISVTGGALSNFTQVNDTTYTATFTAGANPGNASVRVDKSAFQDEAGNANNTASNLALTITQTPNTPPESADKAVTFGEDGSHTFSAADFAFSDPDQGHTLQAVRIDTLPDKGTLTLNGTAVATGQIIPAAELDKLVYTPEANGNGDNYTSFTFSVRDSEDAFDPTPNTLSFNVTAENDAPQAVDDHANTAADTPVTVDVLANDSDIDGDSLRLADVILANPAQGRADIVGNQIRFTPAAGVNGDVAIAYTVTDGKGGGANATLTVTVGPDTTPPTLAISAANPSLKPGENTQITFTLSEKVAGFDASDISVTGGTLSNFTQVNDTTYTATFTAGANPGNASVRVDTSAFQDEAGNANDTASNLALVISNAPDTTSPTLTISAANPSLKPGENTQITFTLSEKVAGFDASDISVTGGALSNFTQVNDTTYTATFTAGANPGNASVRVDTSAFQDEAGNANDTASNLALTITQTSNTPPKAVNDNATTKVGEAVTVDVLKNDSDADGDTLTITSATLANPAQGRADIVGNQIRFTPAAGVNGDVAIAYTVTDGKGGSANATLTVTVDDKLPPPTFTKGEGTDHGSVTITPHETALSMEGRYQQTPTLSSPFKIFRNSVDEPWQFDAGTDKKLLVLNPETGAVTLVAGVVMGGGKVTASNSRGAETSTDNATADIAPDGKYLVSIIGDNSVTEGLGAKYYVILNKPATEEVRINAKVRYVGSADASDFEVEGAAFKFAAGERIKDVSLNTSLRFDRSIKKVTDPYEGDENYKMELTFEGLSSLAGSASTTSNWTANKKHEFVETVIIDRLPYYEPLVQVVNQGEVSISAQAGAEKLSIRYENEQGQQQAIVLANVDKARNLWEAENPLPTDVVLHDSYVVLSAKAVKDGSVVTAFHSSSDGAKTGESITATAGNNPSPKIISGTTGADGDDILIAPDVDPADYATLLAPPRYEAYQELDARAELLLGQSANDVPLMLDGKAGNDILISLNSADTLRGGDGLDTFVFITDEKASLTADKILDFHAGMDKIFLLGGQREITNARFDEGTQTLHYQSGQGADMYHHSIVIQADHGNPLLAYDVEKAVIIL